MRLTIIIVGILAIILILIFRDRLFTTADEMGDKADPKDITLKLPSTLSHGFIRSIVIIALYAILMVLFGYSLFTSTDWPTTYIVITVIMLVFFCLGLVLELRKLLRQPLWTFSNDGFDIRSSLLSAETKHYDWSQLSRIIYQVELSDKCKSEIIVHFNDSSLDTISLNLDEHPGVLGSGLTAQKHNHWISNPLNALCHAHDVSFELL